MKESEKRKIEMSIGLIPKEGTPEFDQVKTSHKKMMENPEFKKLIKDSANKAYKTLDIQMANGADLKIDKELRYYLQEFNYRSWNHGHRSMPLMFNVMEAFFNLDKSVNSWKLLDEEDYRLSFYDFLDYYTSRDFSVDIERLKKDLEEDLIYNYNFWDDNEGITFKTTENIEYIVSGVSLVRRGLEVSILFLTGQITDTSAISKTLKPLDPKQLAPGKDFLSEHTDRVMEAVKLNDDPNLWKVLIACRLDLESETLDARYIAKDQGNSFSVITDDPTGFLNSGEWKSEVYENTFKNMINSVQEFNSIFELAKAVIFLPDYINYYQEHLVEEEVETQLKSLIKNPIQQREYKNVEPVYKIRNRPVWVLNRISNFQPDSIEILDKNFKLEHDGYWKSLTPDEMGKDKKLRPTIGRTWVERTLSYYQSNLEPVRASKINNVEWGPESGYIYILRNATFEKDIYKIGRTGNLTEVRAGQLSKTSIPDTFYVMRDWRVEEYKKAEKMIHTALQEYRLDSRREFFRLEMKIANEVIDNIVQAINKGFKK